MQPDRPSPGLDMQHGFVSHIIRHQHKSRRAHEELEIEKLAKKHKTSLPKTIPKKHTTSMQFYVPPAARTANSPVKNSLGEKTRESSVPMEWLRYGSCANSMLVEQEIRAYKLGKFPEEIQPYILQSLLDSSVLTEEGLSLVMEDVVKLCIVDCQYCQTGVKLCDAIIQKEESSGQTAACRCLINVCQRYYQNKCSLRCESITKWIAYVNFVCQLFLELKITNSTLEDIVLDCLFTLVGPECLENDDEVDCLVTQLHLVGKPLQHLSPSKVEDLFTDIRDAFLARTTPAIARTLLLQAIELYAGAWKLQENAREFYYQ